jgi:hypothetical protein
VPVIDFTMNLIEVVTISFFCHNGGMSELPVDDVLGADLSKKSVETEVKNSLFDRYINLILSYVSSPTRRREALTAGILSSAEITYDVRKVAREGNEFGNTYDWFSANSTNVGPLPESEALRNTLDTLGDVLEISAAQTVLRAGIYMLNRHAGRELLSDEQTFWVSLAVPLVLKAMHSLGLISIFGLHDRTGDPAPQMLIGQAVAATALIGAHYTARRHELQQTMEAVTGNSDRISRATEALAIESSYENEGNIIEFK